MASIPTSFYLRSLVFSVIVAVLVAVLLLALRSPVLQPYVYFQITLVLGLLAVVGVVLVTVLTQASRAAERKKRPSYQVSQCPDRWTILRDASGDVTCQNPESPSQVLKASQVSALDDAGRCNLGKGVYPWVDLRKMCDRNDIN
jgi:hypothetical protein